MLHRFDSPPPRVCLLRLSAIGDTCHAAALLAALKRAWPGTRFTWIIGHLEAKLMSPILPGVEFITFDKRSMARELLHLRRSLAHRRFDLLLDLQVSLRASLVSVLIKAPIKLGFDRARARELQWLFTNAKVPTAQCEHVLDSFMGFARACGVAHGPASWDVLLPASALDYARRLIPDDRPTLVLSPASSHRARNWSAERYAALADHAASVLGMRVIVAGGPSDLEVSLARHIVAIAKSARTAACPIVNQVGQDTLPQLLALLARATVLVSPDSGPVHMATMVGCPVIGLYAATRTARTGPYYSRRWCVDKFEEAARNLLGKASADVPWPAKIERFGVMDVIEVDDVIQKLDTLLIEKNSLKMRP
ncbi:MAG: glycosyltransferase family 9 protein [Pseudomonadota bacterium]|nr:glycosyltransferase family 9 protein [Pseudomonadota bacterium]